MADDLNPPPRPARRGFLKAGGAAVAAGLAAGAMPAARAADAAPAVAPGAHAHDDDIEPFYGKHQGGITTPQQRNAYFAALDLATAKRADVIALLKTWTDAAARLTRGDTAQPLPATGGDDVAPADSGDALGIGASRLTITFGFGPGLFAVAGKDRYGLAKQRPAALVDLPRFNGDQLIPEKTGGDLFIQACANDAQVAFHAVRQLVRLGGNAVQMRWGQAGFTSGKPGETPRNLMGFKDGTMNPSRDDPAAMNEFVWAGNEGPAWMNGGTYTVVRRIRITLEHWDNTELGFQEQVFGRKKYSGAPIGGKQEFEALDLDAVDKDGNSVIPDNAHARLASPQVNNGAQILRRAYSYNDSANFYIERWPPWRQQTEYDAGLMFVAHQRDPRKGFIPINEKLAKLDIMNQFTTHVGSAIFACPPGAQPGSYIGAALFEA
ncbi:MAG: deferrochelatase/peroxidase EfeB [Burkholderia sp.]|jgi:deferrochelatase/peroxidase EfeB|uniref:iron uptake transporter deferrochelatase/peroxidase subunit n=1 Tax=Burkholderia TaxID=32008 RepID=UPI00158AEAD3|nr:MULTISPECIES: iron uptake transporter deferrochelatase/peroxidase subunit [Burkholderia]MBY8603887.1 deferrochelatase/peroxidase EfeB [Burkholderia arboris]MCA3781498.1 deferrochelatase/peroxidase EfeB [Burkholderia sp.]MCA3784315.1 deferrochelatase/peroxidase EfeB [Burkholderia sp.]MCA3796167.1 deferrochelatase/peroxidase EfeB [Burkholderia sp.]MCA3802037.1 deferrochelatase/peroxidase EfeB [Burkholderia sp.]